MEGTSRRLLTWDEIVQGTDAVSFVHSEDRLALICLILGRFSYVRMCVQDKASLPQSGR